MAIHQVFAKKKPEPARAAKTSELSFFRAFIAYSSQDSTATPFFLSYLNLYAIFYE